MNASYLFTLCAVLALLTACKQNSTKSSGTSSENLHVIVIKQDAYARVSPTDSGKVALVSRGEMLSLIDSVQGWYKVRLTENIEGYLSTEYSAVVTEDTIPEKAFTDLYTAIYPMPFGYLSLKQDGNKVLMQRDYCSTPIEENNWTSTYQSSSVYYGTIEGNQLILTRELSRFMLDLDSIDISEMTETEPFSAYYSPIENGFIFEGGLFRGSIIDIASDREAVKDEGTVETKSGKEQAPHYTDRSFFFLKGLIKDMTLSYQYADNMLSGNTPWKNAEGIHVSFDRQGFITRLNWEEFDHTFINSSHGETLRGEGDPKLTDRYYYVVDSGKRTTSTNQHTLQISLKQIYNGEVVVDGGVTSGDAFFDTNKRLKKLNIDLFSQLLYATEGYTSEKFEYRKETDDLPAFVIQETVTGGDGYICAYEIKYIDMDEHGNWTKANFLNRENGDLELIITRTFTYYKN